MNIYRSKEIQTFSYAIANFKGNLKVFKISWRFCWWEWRGEWKDKKKCCKTTLNIICLEVPHRHNLHTVLRYHSERCYAEIVYSYQKQEIVFSIEMNYYICKAQFVSFQ